MGDFPITESASQLRYIAGAFAANLPETIYPTDFKARASVDKWLDWSISSFRPNMTGPIIAYFVAPKDDTFPGVIEAHLVKQNAILDKLEGFLARSGTDFIAGNDITIADFHIFHEGTSEFFASNPKSKDNATARPFLTAWRARVLENATIKEINDKFESDYVVAFRSGFKIE